MKVPAYAALSAQEELTGFEIERREVTKNDVEIDIEYCGVCHSDIHSARNEWGGTHYPVVPGHEIIGRVKSIGPGVNRFKIGDLVGVGCLVESCRTCSSCEEHLEQYCEAGATMTYGSEDPVFGSITHGGYSTKIVVNQDFVLRIPENIDPKGAAPLLCAGITTWSPLKHWKVGKGQRVGVIGLGGLGHMGVKFAHAMGAHVVMITRSMSKAEDARALGADEVLLSTDEAAMERNLSSFDFLLNTIPVKHDLNPYIELLKRDGTMVIVGAIEPVDPVNGAGLVMKRRAVAGSLIGGLKETQEMLDYCGEHNIISDHEVIRMQDINFAYERMIKGDVKYRFVIDMSSLKN